MPRVDAEMPVEDEMHRFATFVVAAILCGGIVGIVSAAGRDPVVTFDAARAKVYAGTLLKADGSSASDLARSFLQKKGKAAATLASLKVDSQFTWRGVTFVRLRQEVGGLRIHGAYVRAAVNERGVLIHVISNIVGIRGGALGGGTAAQAMGASLAKSHPGVDRPAVIGRIGKTVLFRKTAPFVRQPLAEKILVARGSGALEQGWLVRTWTRKGNSLHETLVDRGGNVASVELLTARDSYNAYPEDPSKGDQEVLSGAGNGNDESPAGWLAGSQRTTNISGNNASAYLDLDADNRPDAGGAPVNNGNFLAEADLTEDPTTADNQAVAVQNLFFHNNLVHDILYRHGFTEATGNFQDDNFGLGGKDGDAVEAEAQDGSGFDNANFATPPDGSNPRMQMFLWTGAGGTHEVAVGTDAYDAVEMAFGPRLTTEGVTGGIQLIDDGVAAPPTGTVTDACEALPSRSLEGKIALLDRGVCTFVTKTKNAQGAGAIGVIVANNAPGAPFAGSGNCGGCKIPTVMVSQADGATLKALASDTSVTLRKKAVQPTKIDADLDADVIYHEYGHGLTWRMINHMSGPLAGAIGEGSSDTLAFLINGDDRIGEYSSSSPFGIRRAPYDGYPLTYSDWAGASVHNDGEIYAASMWRVLENFQAAGLTADDVLATWVDGMNFTPSMPSPEDMRDGMLASAAAHAPGQVCLIWDAFAAGGIGVGADGGHGNSLFIVESFDVPAACE